MSLVPADADFMIWSIVFGLVAFGFWSEANTRVGRNLTGIIVAMMAAMLLSNLRIMPFESQVYDSIFESLLPIAIPLMLFRADLVVAFRKGGSTVVAFCIGAVGIVIGAFVAAAFIPLGEITAVAAGMYTATYTGGSANFAAMAIAADFNEGATLTSMLAADIIATNLQTMFLIAMPGLAIFRQVFKFTGTGASAGGEDSNIALAKPRGELDLFGAAFAIAVAMLLVYLGAALAQWLQRPPLGIIFTTVFALILSNLLKPVIRLMAHDFEIGLFAIFLFLVALAAGANVSTLVDIGMTFFLFAMLILLVHMVFIVVVGRLFGLDLRSIIIGSTACIGGVTTASAIASAKGWRDLIIPGILAGTIGSSFGTLLGAWVWKMLS